ncbi:MAG: hypothetical protein IKR41_07915 [Bacteroidales bacterium]|nr:hypothetical protein [Bacteroidales bacterium]
MNKIAFLLKMLILSAVFLISVPENSFGQFTVKYYDPDEVVVKTQDLTSFSDVCSITTIISITMTEDYTAESADEFYISIESTVDDDKFFDLNDHTLDLNGGKINAPNDAEFIFKNGTIKSSNAPVIESYSPMRFANITVSSTSDDDQASLIYNNMNVYLEAGCTFTIPSKNPFPSKKFFVNPNEAFLANDLLVFADENGKPLKVKENTEDNLDCYNINGDIYTVKTVDATYFKVEYGDKQKYFNSLEKALQSTSYSDETSVPSSVKITLLKDYARNKRYFTEHVITHDDDLTFLNINVPFDVELDLGGKSFKDTLTLNISHKFIVKNAAKANLYGFFVANSGADIDLDAGRYESFSTIISIQSGAKATIGSSVTFVSCVDEERYRPNQYNVDGSKKLYEAFVENLGGELKIKGGDFSYNSTESDYPVYGVYTKGTTTIESGTFGGREAVAGKTSTSSYINGGTLSITGGSFSGKDAVYMENGNVEITGGTFTGTNDGVYVYGGDLEVLDGTFTASGSSSSQSCSGITVEPSGTATVKGGTFKGKNFGLQVGQGTISLYGGKYEGETAAVIQIYGTMSLNDADNNVQYAFYDADDADDVMLYFPNETNQYVKLNTDDYLYDGKTVLKKATVKKAKPVISPSKLLLGENDEATVTIYNATDAFKFTTIPDGITITKTLTSDEKYTVKTSEGVEGGEYKIVATDGDDEINMIVTVKYKVSAIDIVKALVDIEKEYDGSRYVTEKGTKNYIDGSGKHFYYKGKSEKTPLGFLFTSILYDSEELGQRTITAYIYINDNDNAEYYILTDMDPNSGIIINDAKIIKKVEYTLGVNADVILNVDGDVSVNSFKNEYSEILMEKASDGKIHIKTTDNIKSGTYIIESELYRIGIEVVSNSDITDIESGKWYNEDISLSTLDYTNKVKEIFGNDITLSITVNGENKEIVEQEGENKVKFVVTDKDDILYSKEFIVLLDKTAPTPLVAAYVNSQEVEISSVELLPDDPNQFMYMYYFRQGAKIELRANDIKEAVDKTSGVKTAEYSWDNVDFTAFDFKNNESIPIKPGVGKLYLRATDIAGNKSETFVVAFTAFEPSTFKENSDEESIESAPYYYASKNGGQDMSFSINLNGNSIYSVSDTRENSCYFDDDNEYFSVSGGVVVVKKAYLETLKPDQENILSVYIAPCGDQEYWGDNLPGKYEGQIMKINLDITYTVKINTGYRFSEPTDSEIESFCDGDSVMVTFSLDENYSSADYVSINKLEVPQQSLGTALRFKVPENVLAGGNEKIAVEFYKDGYEANDMAVFPGNYPAQYNIKLYNDVLAVDNSKDLFLADMYHWYLDMVELEGKNRQFLDILNYIQDGVVHKFYVEVTDIEGYRFRVCPSDDFTIEPIQKAKVMKVNTYPNPAKSGQKLFIELENFLDEDYKDIEILIYNQLGGIVQKLSNVEKVTEISLNEGFFSGVVLKDGVKILNFKIIVK